MSKFNVDRTVVEQRQAKLAEVAKLLKQELFGIDDVIDRVITSITAWYTLPELVSRPTIVNLWGMTGVGKTQLVRRLTYHLGFHEQYVEVQMDGVSGQGHGEFGGSVKATIRGLLMDSTIAEGKPGVMLLDEFQRYRTVGPDGSDVKPDRYQDVWMLLSDGKFPIEHAVFKHLEYLMTELDIDREDRLEEMARYTKWKALPDGDPDKEVKRSQPRGTNEAFLSLWTADQLRKKLRLDVSLAEIRLWSLDHAIAMIEAHQEKMRHYQPDYTKLLVFVSGNLDEAFVSATDVENCDTDADTFYEMTKKVDVFKIKRCLLKRFRPEQIARFGNNHIVYPALPRSTYERLIRETCQQYVNAMAETSGLTFVLSDQLLSHIYENAVYPTQGTRPVFSSIQQLLTNSLVSIAAQTFKREDVVRLVLTVDPVASHLVGTADDGTEFRVPVILDVAQKRKQTPQDAKTMVAVHESGHAIAYALLCHTAPLEIKINPASFRGGYMMPTVDDELSCRDSMLNEVAVLLAGTAAEQVMFQRGWVSTGASSDIQKATSLAASYVTRLGLGSSRGLVVPPRPGDLVQTLMHTPEQNAEIEQILAAQMERALSVVRGNMGIFVELVSHLIEHDSMTQEAFIELFSRHHIELKVGAPMPSYHEQWLQLKAVAHAMGVVGEQ